jgi:hypothetical protein
MGLHHHPAEGTRCSDRCLQQSAVELEDLTKRNSVAQLLQRAPVVLVAAEVRMQLRRVSELPVRGTMAGRRQQVETRREVEAVQVGRVVPKLSSLRARLVSLPSLGLLPRSAPTGQSCLSVHRTHRAVMGTPAYLTPKRV